MHLGVISILMVTDMKMKIMLLRGVSIKVKRRGPSTEHWVISRVCTQFNLLFENFKTGFDLLQHSAIITPNNP